MKNDTLRLGSVVRRVKLNLGADVLIQLSLFRRFPVSADESEDRPVHERARGQARPEDRLRRWSLRPLSHRPPGELMRFKHLLSVSMFDWL